MLEPITFTVADAKNQETMMQAGLAKLEEVKPEPVDVAVAGMRLYLTACDMVGGIVNEMRFVHKSKPVRIQFNVIEISDKDEFQANEIDREKQLAVVEAILDAADRIGNFTCGDLLICASRLFMHGVDDLNGSIETLYFRHNKKNHSMRIVSENVSSL